MEDNMASSEVQERKNQIFSKNIRLGLDEYNTFMIEYMCKREKDTFLSKKNE